MANRKAFICLLMKLNSDLMFFLTSKPTVNAIWWNMCNLYMMLNRFFKSLCSGNFIDMKEFLGGFIPKSKWDPDFNPDDLNVVSFKIEELIFLLKSSLICENANPQLLPTDQHQRLIPMMKPLLMGLNEMVSGPCRKNILIVLETPNFYFFPILSRSIENLDHSFYELKDCLILFTLAMIEGEIPEAEKIMAKNLPVAIIEELIVNMIKKMYVREQ